jgi:hypothetical protein
MTSREAPPVVFVDPNRRFIGRRVAREPQRNHGGNRGETDISIKNGHAATPLDICRLIFGRPGQFAWFQHGGKDRWRGGRRASERDRAIGNLRYADTLQDRDHECKSEHDDRAPQEYGIVKIASSRAHHTSARPTCFMFHDRDPPRLRIPVWTSWHCDRQSSVNRAVKPELFLN